MRYTIIKLVHGENARWYAKPLEAGEMATYPIIFLGKNARVLACRKAQSLNQQMGPVALAA